MADLIPVLKCERKFASLPDLLQVVGFSRQYFCVQVLAPEERVLGLIWIKSGFVVDAATGELSGRSAFFALLAEAEAVAFSVYRPRQSPSSYAAPLGSIAELLLEASEAPAPRVAEAGAAEEAAGGLRLAPEAAPQPAVPAAPAPATGAENVTSLASYRAEPSPEPRHILAFASAKGGVGKTTLALNVALAFAESGQPVLLVDADPLGGIGHSLAGQEERQSGGAFDVLLGRKEARDVILSTKVPALEILPAGELKHQEALQNLGRLTSPEAWAALLSPLAGSDRLVIVDLPAGLYGIASGALGACTHAFAVLEAEPLALRVLPSLLQSLDEQRAHGSAPLLAGIILNGVQFRAGASIGVVQGAWTAFSQGLVLETTVPRDPAFLEASAKGVPVAFLDRAKRPAVAAVFRHLADDIAERIGLYEVKPAGEPIRLL